MQVLQRRSGAALHSIRFVNPCVYRFANSAPWAFLGSLCTHNRQSRPFLPSRLIIFLMFGLFFSALLVYRSAQLFHRFWVHVKKDSRTFPRLRLRFIYSRLDSRKFLLSHAKLEFVEMRWSMMNANAGWSINSELKFAAMWRPARWPNQRSTCDFIHAPTWSPIVIDSQKRQTTILGRSFCGYRRIILMTVKNISVDSLVFLEPKSFGRRFETQNETRWILIYPQRIN